MSGPETKNILSRRLPFEIKTKSDFNDLINYVDSEDLETGLFDISRELFFRHEIEFYDQNTESIRPIAPDTDTEIATPSFKEIEKEEGKGFKITKKEWIKNVIRGIANTAISNVIERYGKRFGTDKPPGANVGTVEWLIRVLRITFIELSRKCPEADIMLYKEIQNRLEKYKKQVQKLEERRDELTRIEEKTDSEIDELRDIRNKLERLFRIERGDVEQVDRLKEKCPEIDDIIKEE